MEAIRTPVPAVRSGPRFGRLARSLPDSRLAARVRTGDQAAFEALFERYHRPLLAFCRHMLGTREEAEDALQHVFVAAHRQLVSGDDRVVELRPWLYAVARNRCLSVLRARRDAVALDDVAEPPGAGLAVAEEVQQREDLQAVLADLARLPDEQRAALVLSELGALSHAEVAEVLGVRRDKVKALVFQARESLAGWRQARDVDCREIREQLATLSGAALRRGPLRKHLETCDGCRAFRTEVRHQREALALLLPVVPSVALKAKILGAVAGGGHLVPVAGAGVAGSTGAGLAAKALLVAAIAGTAGGGYAVLHESGSPHRATPATRVIAPAPRTPLPAASPTAAPTPAAALAPLAEARARTRARAVKAHRAKPDHTGRGGSAKAKAKAKAKTKTEAKAQAEAKTDATAEDTPAKGEHGPSSAAKEARHGRPAVPGANGFRHAPKSQGLRHRRSDPPAHGAHGARGAAPGRGSASGASAGRGAEAAAPRSESDSLHPPHPAHSAHPDVPAADRLVPVTG